MQNHKELPLVSGTLVIINVIVFIVCTFTGDLLYNAGSLDIVSVFEQKQYLRILWAMFLHSGMNHLFHNMVILFFLGAMIEKEIGHICYAVFYFASGAGGNVISLLYRKAVDDRVGSIGASGAVFGLDGVLLAMVLFSGRQMENVTPARVLLMIAYSLYSGFTGKNVDNAAHIGGLAAGFAMGTVMCVVQRIGIKAKQLK